MEALLLDIYMIQVSKLNFPNYKKLLKKAKEDPNILAVIVFGSYIKGDDYRDIDICLVLHSNISNPEILLEYGSIFSSHLDFSVYQKLPLYIKHRVQKEGITILNKDYDELFEIFLKTIKNFNMFKPHYDTFLEAVMNR